MTKEDLDDIEWIEFDAGSQMLEASGHGSKKFIGTNLKVWISPSGLVKLELAEYVSDIHLVKLVIARKVDSNADGSKTNSYWIPVTVLPGNHGHAQWFPSDKAAIEDHSGLLAGTHTPGVLRKVDLSTLSPEKRESAYQQISRLRRYKFDPRFRASVDDCLASECQSSPQTDSHSTTQNDVGGARITWRAERNAQLLLGDRLTFGHWVAGLAEWVEPRFIYGDQSDFSKCFLDQFLRPDEESWICKIPDENRLTPRMELEPPVPPESIKTLNDNGNLYGKSFINGFACLKLAIGEFLKTRNQEQPNQQSYLRLKENIVKAIEYFNLCYRVNFSSSGVEATAATSYTPIQNLNHDQIIRKCFSELYSGHSIRSGYWIVLDICERVLRLPILIAKDGANSGWVFASDHARDAPFSAIVPVLFWQKETHAASTHDENKGQGYVLWLTVELFKDFAGSFVPDIQKLGLTDVSGLVSPMDEVWKASDLASKGYRGRWFFSSHYPGPDPDFQLYKPNYYFPVLEGSSLQAAALAALWAASGEIPMATGVNERESDKPAQKIFMVDGQSLRLNPRVAISGSIDWSEGKARNDSIRLKSVGGVAGKIEAVCHYCPSGAFADSLFDTVLILKEEREEARKLIPAETEKGPTYRGVHLIEDCNTMADALLWMLEVNAWKFELNQAVTHDWESQWGYARDVNGVFLNRTSGDPVLFSAESAGNDVTEAWKKYFDCPIMVDDDTQKVTLQLKNGQSKAELDQELLANQEALRNRLIEIVKTHGINTGTLDYMANPIGGAEDAGESDPEDVSSENPDSDDSGRDDQSVLGDE